MAKTCPDAFDRDGYGTPPIAATPRHTCYSLPNRENDRSMVNDRLARAIST